VDFVDPSFVYVSTLFEGQGFVQRRVEFLAPYADTLDAQIPKRVEQLMAGDHDPAHPRVVRKFMRHLFERPIQLVEQRQDVLDGVAACDFPIASARFLDAALEVSELGAFALPPLEDGLGIIITGLFRERGRLRLLNVDEMGVVIARHGVPLLCCIGWLAGEHSLP
jgi:hypothetical protein